jgi:cell division protein FtsZ
MELDSTTSPKHGMPLNVRFMLKPDSAGTSMVLLNRFNPDLLRPQEVSKLVDTQARYESRRSLYEFGYLRLIVDGEEAAIFSPKDTTCEPFSVSTTTSFIEVQGEDHDGELLLAVFPLTHLDPCQRLDNYRASMPCGQGQFITLLLSSLPETGDEHTHWAVGLECAFASVPSTDNTHAARVSEGFAVTITDECIPASHLLRPETSLPQPNGNPLVRIVVMGIGSSGSNTIDKLIESGVRDVTFAAINTDLQALQQARAPIKVQLAPKLTQGRGTGGDVEAGRTAALESTDKLIEVLQGADMVFVTTGLGGGTGTGAAPVVASLARDLGALAVTVVTTPFAFEGTRRAYQAECGLRLLCESADTLITLPNERLLHTLRKAASLREAFDITDGVMQRALQSILDLVAAPGLINLDFADVRTIMSSAGNAFFGTGCAGGDFRALCAVEQAIASPLFNEATIEGARGVLVNVTGGTNLTLHEVNEAASIIQEVVDPNANIIFGAVIDESMPNEMKVTVIATGFGKTHYDTLNMSPPYQEYMEPLPRPASIMEKQTKKGGLAPSILRKFA